MPEMSKTTPEEELNIDFDEEKDDLAESIEEKAPEDDLLEEKPQGFFSRLADKIKGFFKDIKDKITASLQQRVQERKDLHEARVNSAYNKAVMGKENYHNAIAKEYNEAHKRGDVNLLAENEGHKSEKPRSVEEMMRGESAFDKVDKTETPTQTEPLVLAEGITYDATVKKILPDKNLMIVDVGGTEARVHASQFPKDKPIDAFKKGDTFEAVCIEPYNGHPSLSVTKLEEDIKNVEARANKDNENSIASSEEETNPFDSGLTEEELAALFYNGEIPKPSTEEKAESEEQSEIPNIFAEETDKTPEPTAEEMSEIPPEVVEEVSPNSEPVSHIDNGPTNHICYDVSSFEEVTNTKTQRTVTLIGGKGSVELVGTCDGTAWTYKNGNDKKISDEKATAILSQHKNVGDIGKAMSAYLLAKKEAFDKFKETSDRAESAFEPTVFRYEEKAVVVTHEGKAIEVAPMLHSDDAVRETFKFNKNGIDNAAKATKTMLTEKSLDKGDDLVEEDKEDPNYIPVDGYDENQPDAENVSERDSRTNWNNQNREDVENDDLGI